MKNQTDVTTLVGLGLVVVAVVILVAVLLPQPAPVVVHTKAVSSRDKATQDVVNNHLEMTAAQLDLQRRRAEIEAQKLKLQKATTGEAYQVQPEGVNLNNQGSAQDVADDIGVDHKVPATSPMDMIQQQIFQEQQAAQMNEEAKKEYARQFVENARRGGYDVVLDEEYRVVSVKAIRKPAKEMRLFEDGR